ncbi:MAG: hypothetical protein ACK5V3_06320 [Bdellovibrionales bacterium]
MKLLFCIFLYGISAWSQKVVTQTVGTSAFQVVTSRDVKASVILDQVLKNKAPENYRELSSDEVNRVLFEFAIYRESQNLSAVKLNESDFKALISDVENRLKNRQDWKALEASQIELKNWLERKRVAMTFFDLKVNSLIGIVTEDEIKDYFDKNRIKFGSSSFESQKNSILLFLKKQNQKQRIEDWVSALKSKYQVRNDLTPSTENP